MAFDDKTFYQIALFYSLLTFFIGPKVAKMLKINSNDPCMIGMIVGFLISMILWNKFGYNMVYSGKSNY